MSRYDSDGSTLVNSHYDRRRNHRERYRSPSEDRWSRRRSSYREESDTTSESPQHTRSGSTLETLAKVALVIGIFHLAREVLHSWHTEKTARNERDYRRRRRMDFDRVKAARRRDEERWERQQGWDDEHSQEREVRQIGYVTNAVRSRSTSRAPRKIEPPPSRSGRSSRRSSVSERTNEDEYRERSRRR